MVIKKYGKRALIQISKKKKNLVRLLFKKHRFRTCLDDDPFLKNLLKFDEDSEKGTKN